MQQDLSSGMAALAVWPFTNQTGKFFMFVAAQRVWLLGGGGGEGMGGGGARGLRCLEGGGASGTHIGPPLCTVRRLTAMVYRDISSASELRNQWGIIRKIR